MYSYVTMGEFTAFLIGWTLILEYVIGSASVVRGLSTYVDNLFNNTMRNAFETAAPIDISHLSSYPDFFAFGITLIFSGKTPSAKLTFTSTEVSIVLIRRVYRLPVWSLVDFFEIKCSCTSVRGKGVLGGEQFLHPGESLGGPVRYNRRISER